MLKLIAGSGGSPAPQQAPKQKAPQTDPDSLDSRAYANIIDVLSEGEIGGLVNGSQSIFFNRTALQNADGSFNFQDITSEIRVGTQSQAPVEGFSQTLSELLVNTVVTQPTPLVRTITRTQVNAVRVTVTVPQLQEINSKGDLTGARIDLRIETQTFGGSYVTRITDRISGRTGDPYQRSYVVPITAPFPVNVRVTRITADSTDPNLVNAFSWTSYTEITYDKLSYPNSAYVATRLYAQQFSSIPERSYLIKGIKIQVPNNATIDSATGAPIYSGSWGGTFSGAQWSSCPAWCLWDLLVNKRYGFGNFLDGAVLDKWAFYQASVYCAALNTRPGNPNNDYGPNGKHGVPDGFGGWEPRFSLNINIQNSEDAYKLVNDLCSVFRAMPFWSTGSLTLAQDAPQSPVYIFNLSNVSPEGFSYSGSAQKTRATVAIVKYFDMTLRDFAYELVENQAGIAKYGVQTTEVDAVGCTSQGQAHRLGDWILYAQQNETETVSFTISLEAGVIVRPGQVISVADPVRAGVRRGGRITAAGTSVNTADDASSLTLGSSPTFSVILPSGVLETRPVTGIAGNNITVSPAFSAAPGINAPWLFANTALQPTTWRVLTVVEEDDVNYRVTALSYNASKYAYVERGVALDIRKTTLLTEIPGTPTGLSLREALFEYVDEIRVKLSAEWITVEGVDTYEVQWRKDSGNWNVARSRGPVFEILDITPGFFEFKVFAVSLGGFASGTPATASITTLGKTAPPADVTGFTAGVDPDIGVTLRWNKNNELDLQGYEIWEGASWGTGTKIGLFKTTAATVGLLPNGTVSWWIKSLDTSGTYSVNATGITITISIAPAPTVSGSFRGPDVELRWTPAAGTLSTQAYEVRYGAPGDLWSAATSVGTVQGTVFTTKAVWAGTRRWFVAAFDLVGSYGVAGTWDGLVTVPTAPTITQEVIDNNVLLRWTDSTATLPIVGYELRKGATWAGATVIGTKQGRFTTVFETTSGIYTYWLAGIDSAGNYGTPASVSASVNQPPDYVLNLDFNSTFSGARVNVYDDAFETVLPVSTTETWQTHFTSRGWNTLQDQVTAGFPFYGMPSTTTASYEETIDYGSVVAGTKITMTLTSNQVTGSVTITPTIGVKLLVGDPWTNYPGLSSVFATNFRYVRVRYDFASAGGDDLMNLASLNVRLDSKLRNDFGTGNAVSTDVGGTLVNFNLAFVDVIAISVSPATTSAFFATYNFVDIPNPTFFRVLIFDAAGTRVSAPFSWSARGV